MARQPLPASLSKALLAGLAGGLAGSLAKVAAEKLFPPRTEGQTTPPEKVVERAADAVHARPGGTAKKAAAEGLHWGFGTLTGGAYGVAAEFSPRITAWRGAAFGLGVNRLMHEGALPFGGFAAPVKNQTAQERVSEWVTHAVYGIVTELVRGAVRKRL